MNREKKIIQTSMIGIFANVLLAAFKAAVGILSGSIAITMDAVNNISDALSSLITIIGTKLAGRAPDKKHPLGYGRIEYLSATIISAIVLYAGITAFLESVKAIFAPSDPSYSAVTLIIVAAAIIVKLLLGSYVKRVGNEVNSDSLIASGQDALNDSVISVSTLAAAFIYLLSGIRLEAWLGAVIGVVIVKSGIEMMRDTISEILGERVDSDLAKRIKKTAVSVPGVQGAYDLTLHNYGPDRFLGSMHISVPETMTAGEIDRLQREVTDKVFCEEHVILTGISIYSINTMNPEVMEIEKQIAGKMAEYPHILQMHGFYLNAEKKTVQFDIVISYDANRKELKKNFLKDVEEILPGYQININLDFDIAD
ncbi:MAG: cation diffusion facilitator family transporter [Lachnospiraceae bacterium]|nr:cation diffusion facilitator family transporter [Lachnospiraceae bacterium]